MTTHRSQVPALVAAYFGISILGIDGHPLITSEFRPSWGWGRSQTAHRVSVSWLRKLRAEGVTSVALRLDGRVADFTIAEILAHQRRVASQPLLAGTVI